VKSESYRTLADVARENALAFGDKPAIIFEDQATSFADLDRQSDHVCARLRTCGVVAGDRVALLARNSAAYIVVLFGIAKARAVATPLNWRLSPPEIAQIVADADARVIIVDAASEAQAPRRAGLHRLTLDEALMAPDGMPAAAEHAGPPSRDDLAALVYTSGTTGLPKGVMITHANFARYCDLASPSTPPHVAMRADDICLAALPMFHVGGIEYLLRPLFTGATTVLHRDFDVGHILDDIARYKVTVIGLVPTAMHMMLRHPRSAETDFSSLRRFIYGASPIAIDLLKEGVRRLDCEFLQSYGMTETSGTCAMLAPEDHADPQAPRMRAAGRAIPGAEIKIADINGNTLPSHQVGEILVRGSGIMAGYWRRPDATQATLLADGWLRSGDAGYMDEDGYVYVHDRIKDMIISGAENIYPAEVESAIYGHDAVAEAAVIGVPDETWGEAVKAVIVLKLGAYLDPEELIAWTKTRIASYKAPKSVDFVSELPKNGAGKVLRRAIRDMYRR
jgi:long-chain acyl-CoA synthetase